MGIKSGIVYSRTPYKILDQIISIISCRGGAKILLHKEEYLHWYMEAQEEERSRSRWSHDLQT